MPASESGWRAFFAAHPRGVVAAYLYGSVARGDDHAGSDVDVAVLFATAPPPDLSGPSLRLADGLERALGRPVDLVILNSAPADLVHRVLRDGALVMDRDRSRRLRFEVQKRNDYFDLEPVQRLYRRGTPRLRPGVAR